MLTFFRTLPWVWRAVSLAVVLGGLATVVGGGIAFVRHQGFVAGYAKAKAEDEAERQRQVAANKAAIDAANKHLLELADELDAKNRDLDNALAYLDATASADPDGVIIALPSASVRRLNTIR